jgi:hypothetical protein
MNIKHYKFSSNFDIEFCSGIVNVDVEVIHSTIQEKHLGIRCCPQKWSTPTGSPSTRSNRPESRPHTRSHPLTSPKGRGELRAHN